MINKYKIHVINRDLNFDPTYKNVVQFFNPTDNTKDYTGVFTSSELYFTPIEEEINFNIIDSINASVSLDINGEFASRQFMLGVNEVLTLEKALNRQYCIIRKYEYTDEETFIQNIDYFYFMKNPRAINENLVKYDLQLDVFTTYPLFSDIDVSKTKITRAHVDRFTNDSVLNNATYNFNIPYLETAEPFDNIFTKIKDAEIEKNFIDIFGTTYYKHTGSATRTNEQIEDILNNTMWLYCLQRLNNGGGASIKNKIWCAPFVKNKLSYNNISFIIANNDDLTDASTLQQTINANLMYDALAEDTHLYNAFISPLSPFGSINASNTNYHITYDYDDVSKNIKIIFVLKTSPKAYNKQNFTDLSVTTGAPLYFDYTIDNDISQNYGFYIGYNDNIEPFISYFETASITLFEKTYNLISNTYNYDTIKEAEPKTKVRQCYNEFILKTELDTGVTYLDLSILKTNEIKIKAINNLSNNTNGEMFITANDLYIKDLGIRTQPRYTPTFYSDKFKEYKQAHQNYIITGQALPIATGTIAGAFGGASKGGAFGAVVGGIIGFGASALKVNENFDAMKNSLDAIKLKGESNAIDGKIKDRYFNIEHNILRERDEKEIILYLYEYGYTINAISTIKDFFKRSSFNYIQLENCEKDVHALLSTDILNVVIKALNDGVRFWTKTKYIASKFEYTTNNLESKLF